MAHAKRHVLLALTTILVALLPATMLASGGSESTQQQGPLASEICVTALGSDWVCIDIL